MNLINVENIRKSYGDKSLFEDISFSINEGEKIGLIGVNGTGKTTLLNIISGKETLDSGKITKKTGLQMEYLEQNTDFQGDLTVLEQVFTGDTPSIALVREYKEVVTLAEKEPTEENRNRIILLAEKMDALNAWSTENEAKTILTTLGILDFSAKISTLSGGQKKRVALATALINPSELLILDEPTNHMDNDSISWLETYLKKRRGSILMVTHDRYFLDRVVNKTLELDNGEMYTYIGNYSSFLEKKLEREESLQSASRKWKKLYENELAWIRKGAKARTTKQKARIDRFDEIRSDKVEIDNDKIEIVTGGSRLGKKIIELKDINKSFPNKVLLKDFSYIILKNDRVGIVGPNGIGKSTLLNIIAGNIKPDSGTIDVGQTVKIGYFSQETFDMDLNLRVIDYIKQVAEFLVTSDGTSISASQLLDTFLFNDDKQWTYISKLSGGERRRLYLLYILMGAPNILLLDEPTNDLDIETLTIFEDYIEGFNGGVIAVSHDRYFLDRISEKIFSFEGDGVVKQYTGNYSLFNQISEEKLAEKKAPAKEAVTRENTRAKKLKLSFKEEKEYEAIDGLIADLENKLSDFQAKVNFCGSDYEALNKILVEKEKIQKETDKQYARWEYLNELVEQIDKQ